MDIINGFRQIFSRRPSQNDVERLARFMKSKQGIKLTAQLMQQTDSLTKKDVAAWRSAWQQAISYDTPNRARGLYDFYTDCLIDLHLTGCIGQRKGKTLQKGVPLGRQGRKGE